MRLRELIPESWRAMFASRVPSTIIAVLCLAMSAATILTVGQAEAADLQLQERLETAGARQITISSSNPTLIPAALVNYANSLNTVSQTVGVHRVVDISNSASGTSIPTPATMFSGEFESLGRILSGRAPQENEAVLSISALKNLGFDAPVGAVTDSKGNNYAVVGSYEPVAPFHELGMALIRVDTTTEPYLMSVRIVATTAADTTNLQSLLISSIAAPNSTDLEVTSPETLKDLRADLRADFGNYSRSLFLMILLGGGTLLGIVVFADTLLHSKDFGRRRALGISRAELTALVTLRTVWAAAFGTTAGGIGSWLYLIQDDIHPPSTFVASVCFLVLLCCALCAAVPALFAAYRDPVAVLRTA